MTSLQSFMMDPGQFVAHRKARLPDDTDRDLPGSNVLEENRCFVFPNLSVLRLHTDSFFVSLLVGVLKIASPWQIGCS